MYCGFVISVFYLLSLYIHIYIYNIYILYSIYILYNIYIYKVKPVCATTARNKKHKVCRCPPNGTMSTYANIYVYLI